MSTTAERSDKRTDRRERLLMAGQGMVMLLAAFSLIWWASGHYVWTPGWLVIAALQAYMLIKAIRTIRQIRRKINELQQLWAEVRDSAGPRE